MKTHDLTFALAPKSVQGSRKHMNTGSLTFALAPKNEGAIQTVEVVPDLLRGQGHFQRWISCAKTVAGNLGEKHEPL